VQLVTVMNGVWDKLSETKAPKWTLVHAEFHRNRGRWAKSNLHRIEIIATHTTDIEMTFACILYHTGPVVLGLCININKSLCRHAQTYCFYVWVKAHICKNAFSPFVQQTKVRERTFLSSRTR